MDKRVQMAGIILIWVLLIAVVVMADAIVGTYEGVHL